MTREQFIDAVAREQESLRRFLLVMCRGDSFKADDIAQEALLKAYLSFEHFHGLSSFSTWLFRIAYNCLYDSVHKKQYAEHEQLETLKHYEGDGPPDSRFEYEDLYMAIGRLSDSERVVTLLFYMEDKSIKDIESITNMPSGTIRSHLSRARTHLKEFLNEKRSNDDNR